MDKFGLYVPQLLPFKEYFLPEGHRACMGCGVALGVRHVCKALEEKRELLEGARWEIPYTQPLLSTLAGEKKDSSHEPRPALLRLEKGNGKNLLLCFDNEAVEGKPTPRIFKKSHPALAVARGFHYAATACPSYPFDLIDKVKRGAESEGDSYIHILSPCPVGWDFESELTINIGRLAVECALFPLYETVMGTTRLTIDHPKLRPVEQYLTRQKRFAHVRPSEYRALQSEIDRQYAQLRAGKR